MKRKHGEADDKLVQHGLRCKNGYHRAVACTELLASAFRNDGFFVTASHVEEAKACCGCPRDCRNLNNSSEWTLEKQAAVAANWAADGAAAHAVAGRLFALY